MLAIGDFVAYVRRPTADTTLPHTEADLALLQLLQALKSGDYGFVTPTPATHARVTARPGKQRAKTVRDVFGWSLPFEPEVVGEEILGLMERGGVLQRGEGGLRSAVRVSNLNGWLFLHSAYPTDEEDSVFFGPDTYRFVSFIEEELSNGGEGGLVVDIGAGSGAGGLVAAVNRPGARLLLSDVNAKALRLARINAAHAGIEADTVQASGVEAVTEPIDVAIANPPYMIDSEGRTYREGGDMHGAGLSLEWAKSAAERLAPGGRLLMYTGAAIVDGRDAFREAVGAAMDAAGCEWRYRELDPDVFGEELERDAYRDVERIAAVGLAARKRG